MVFGGTKQHSVSWKTTSSFGVLHSTLVFTPLHKTRRHHVKQDVRGRLTENSSHCTTTECDAQTLQCFVLGKKNKNQQEKKKTTKTPSQRLISGVFWCKVFLEQRVFGAQHWRSSHRWTHPSSGANKQWGGGSREASLLQTRVITLQHVTESASHTSDGGGEE